jgi:hypothetical protein
MFARFAYVEESDDAAASAPTEVTAEPEAVVEETDDAAAEDRAEPEAASTDNQPAEAPSGSKSSFFSELQPEPALPTADVSDTAASTSGGATPVSQPAAEVTQPTAEDAARPASTSAAAALAHLEAADWVSRRHPHASDAIAAPPAKRHKPLPLMGAGERDGIGTIGHETRPEVLINTWQSMAAGASSPANRRFIIVCGVILSSQTMTGTACRAVKALRDAARADGAEDLEPAWLSTREGVSEIISMVNFRNNKAKFVVALATSVKCCRGRVAESSEGYVGYKGVGKELAGLLNIVNTAALAEEWCQREAQ